MASAEDILKLPIFHGLLPREDVQLMLKNNGEYLVRSSEPGDGHSRHYIVSLMENKELPGDGIRHYVLKTENGKFSALESQVFSSINELLTYHTTKPINPTVPASILITPVNRQPWELSHENIIMTKKLGAGAFGEVHAGIMKTETEDVNVAIKVAKLETCTKDQIKEIMTEARIMRNFNHPNVVKCFGVAVASEPLLVVMELMSDGALVSYIKKTPPLKMEEKVEIIIQIARGLAHIHEKKIIHRDIAARNCLYGNKVAKVADFGMSRAGPNYKMSQMSSVPVKWLAPETLLSFIYSPQTDVYSFGIFCWEVLENGHSPYPGFENAEVRRKVMYENYRMSLPSETPSVLSSEITKCWLKSPNDRPTMVSFLSAMECKPSQSSEAAKTASARSVSLVRKGELSASKELSKMRKSKTARRKNPLANFKNGRRPSLRATGKAKVRSTRIEPK